MFKGLLILLAIIAVFSLMLVLKRIRYLMFAAKSGAVCILVFLTACFIYGLFNRFSFIHGASPPGLDSALAYMFFGGIIAGPLIFIAGGICIALAVYYWKR